MKLQFVSVMAVCLLLVPCTIVTGGEQGEPWNRHQGFYAEAGLGTGFGWILLPIDRDDSLGGSAFDGLAWVGSLGYGLTSHHAIEGGVGQWYASYEEERDAGHLNVGYVAYRGTVPIKDRFALFGKLGGMYTYGPDAHDPEIREGGWSPFAGLGMSYAVTPQIDISLQYQGAFYVIAAGGLLTLGAAYHF